MKRPIRRTMRRGTLRTLVLILAGMLGGPFGGADLKNLGVAVPRGVHAGALHAQEPEPAADTAAADTFALEELIVTATRVPVPREAVTANVTVIEGEELRARGIERVADALRSLSGASIERTGSWGGATALHLRGGESDYVQVLVDGVPINEPGGAFDFANLTTANVERIEVVRGPASVLYGSDAMAGVVQVFTRRGADEPRATASARGGSHGTAAWEAAIHGGTGTADYAFAASRFRTDGIYAFNNRHRNTVLSGRIALRPDRRTDADLSVRFTDHVYHYPTDGQGHPVDANAFDFGDDLTLGLTLRRALTDRLDAELRLGVHEVDRGVDDRPDGPADTLGTYGFRSLDDVGRRSVDARIDYRPMPSLTLTGGAVLERQRQRGFNESASEFGVTTGTFRAERTNAGYYAQALAEVGDGIALNAGARLDDNEAFGTFATYRAGIAYTLATGTRLHVGAGTGFKEPTILESFATGFAVGNPSLEPERSTSREAGVEQALLDGRIALAGTYYDQRFEDLIQFTASPAEPGDPNFFNVAAATASGVELDATVAAGGGLRFTARYGYTATEVTNPGFDSGPDAAYVDGDPLLRRPAHTAGASLGYRPAGRVALHAGARYVGERDDRDFSTIPATRVTLEPYTLVDLGGGLTVLEGGEGGPGLTITARVANVFDVDYREVANFETPGRTVLVGARFGAGR